jgi:hypothetical protein
LVIILVSISDSQSAIAIAENQVRRKQPCAGINF